MLDEKFVKIAKKLSVTLQCEQFFVTGSAAMKAVGLPVEATDLDIILVQPTEECKQIVKRLMEQYPVSDIREFGKTGLIAQFKEDDIKIDVFESDKKRDVITVDGLSFSTFEDIRKAKLESNRVKDYVQLYQLSESIMKRTEFIQKMSEAKSSDFDRLPY